MTTDTTTPSGPYNDIRLAVEALGYTITRISNLYLSRAVDGGLSAEVEAVRTATGPTNRAVWHITWYPTEAGGWQVSFGSGDYTVERTDTAS